MGKTRLGLTRRAGRSSGKLDTTSGAGRTPYCGLLSSEGKKSVMANAVPNPSMLSRMSGLIAARIFFKARTIFIGVSPVGWDSTAVCERTQCPQLPEAARIKRSRFRAALFYRFVEGVAGACCDFAYGSLPCPIVVPAGGLSTVLLPLQGDHAYTSAIRTMIASAPMSMPPMPRSGVVLRFRSSRFFIS